MKKKLLASMIGSVIGLSATLPGAVYAEGFTLEEVIVTSRKQEESMQDIPLAITSFDADDMTQLNVTKTQDLASFTPGLFITPAIGQSGTVATSTLRGQVQTDTIISLDPSVGWYIDDVYLARAAGTNTSMYDLERVEVLKGPQGTLFGRNTTGGAIRLITKKAEPSEGVTGFVEAGVGNYEQEKIGFGVNVPIIDDQLAIRLTALSDEVNEGFQDITIYEGSNPLSPSFLQPTGETAEGGTSDNELYRLGVTWEGIDNLRVLANYEYNKTNLTMAQKNKSTEPGFAGDAPTLPTVFPLQPTTSDFYDVAVNLAPYGLSETNTASLTVEYELNDDLTAKFVYGYRHLLSEFDADPDATAVPVSQFIFPFTQNARQNSAELQVAGYSFDEALTWVAGVYWFEESGEDFSRSGSLSGFGTGQLYNFSKSKADANESQSAFFQGTYDITHALSVTAGIRYTEDTKPIEVTSYGVGFAGTPLASNLVDLDGDGTPETATACRFDPDAPNANYDDCTWSETESYDFVSWTLGVDWEVQEDILLYAKAASSSRAGGQNIRGLDAATTQPFDVEEATDIEFGMKGVFLDRSLQVNMAYYHTFYEDIQQSSLINHPTGLITVLNNEEGGDIDGLEIDAKWIVSENLQILASANFIEWSLDKNSSGGEPILPATPTREYTLRANYFLPVDYGDWLFDINASYRNEVPGNCSSGQYCLDNFDAATSDDLLLVGARVGLDVGDTGLNVSLWGRNLTDEEYSTPGLQLFFPGSLAISNQTLGSPRTYGVEAKYSF